MGLFKKNKKNKKPENGTTPKCGFLWANGGKGHTHACKENYGHRTVHKCKSLGCNATHGTISLS